MSARRVPFAGWLALIVGAVALLFVPSLWNDFVNWDDYTYVLRNPLIRGLPLGAILSPASLTASDWTPSVTLSHAVEFNLFGVHPLPYHATNVCLHLLSVVLVAILLRRIGFAEHEALLAALLFGVHPLQVEPVAWVSARKDLLATVFGLAFVWDCLAGRPILATLMLLMALGSKGTAVVFPLWAAATAHGKPDLAQLRQPIVWLALFFALAAARGLVTGQAQDVVVARTAQLGFVQRMAVMGPVLATQLRQFVAPYDLAAMYKWGPLSWSDWQVGASWLLVAAGAAWTIYAASRAREVALAGWFCATALLPTANLWPAPFFQADRYVHLALVGGVGLAVAALRPLARVSPRLPLIVVLAWCVGSVPLTLERIRVWQHGGSLWTDVVRRIPDFAVGWGNLGWYYRSVGDLERARAAYERAIALDGRLRYDWAVCLSAFGRRAEAESELRALLAAYPDDPAALAALGDLLASAKRFAESEEWLNRATTVSPNLGFARLARARMYVRAQRFADAESDLTALSGPGRVAPAVWVTWSSLRLAQGRPTEAVAVARRATEADPGQTDAWLQLARALVADGHVEAAAQALQDGIRVAQQPADLQYEAALLCDRAGDRAGARAAARAALERTKGPPPEWQDAARALAAD